MRSQTSTEHEVVQERSRLLRSSVDLLNRKYLDSSDLYIKAVSFSSSIHDKKFYIIDHPYRYFYDAVNEYASEQGLDISSEFLGESSKNIPDLLYLYYDYRCESIDSAEEDIRKIRTEKNINPDIENCIPRTQVKNIRFSPEIRNIDDSSNLKDEFLPLAHWFAFDPEYQCEDTDLHLLMLWKYTEFDSFSGFLIVFLEASQSKVKKLPALIPRLKSNVLPVLEWRAWQIVNLILNNRFMSQALRSSIAAIMSRNMSHNIGSHVLWHIAQDLKKDKNFDDDDLGEFMLYLQKRMDLIAQVSTSPPSWSMAMDWKNAKLGFKQKCLLSNIVRSSKIDRENIDIEYRGSDPPVDIPHGRVGMQAFYTILENLIRNAAKHGDSNRLQSIKEGDGKLKFTVTLEADWEDVDESSEWSEKFNRLRIKDNLPSDQEVAEELNSFLSEHIVSKTGSTNPENWGMKEIKICAAYLRAVKQEAIDLKYDEWKDGKHLDSDSEEPPLVEVETAKEDGEEHLQYTFYLQRPKVALVVGTSPDSDDKEAAYRQKGFDFCSFDDLRTRVERRDVLRHQFLVLVPDEDRIDWQWLWENIDFLPYRILVHGAKKAAVDSELRGPGVEADEVERIGDFLSFFDDELPLDEPKSTQSGLWERWTQSQWWSDHKLAVRWNRHSETVAEIGGDETWTPNNPGRLLTFDHKPDSDDTDLYEHAAYHQSIKSNFPTAVLLQDGDQFRIKEACAMSVAVVDERIWKEREEKATTGVIKYDSSESKELAETWKKRRVYLKNTDKAFSNFKRFVAKNLGPPHDVPFDFLIIHQSIIGDAKEKLGENFEPVWEELKSKTRWLIVDTGRGVPDQAREENLRWVEYSNLAECLIRSAGDKRKLMDLLWSVRAGTP